jgi:hypothetical protein
VVLQQVDGCLEHATLLCYKMHLEVNTVRALWDVNCSKVSAHTGCGFLQWQLSGRVASIAAAKQITQQGRHLHTAGVASCIMYATYWLLADVAAVC